MEGAARVAYFEWSVDADDPSAVPADVRADPEMWVEANPGLGIRISLEHISNEHDGALGPREFAVERLGVGDWPNPEEEDGRVFRPGVWSGLRDPESGVDGAVCFAFDVSPDRSSASIGAAGLREDGRRHVEIVQHGDGTGWVVDRVAALVKAHRNVGVVADGVGPAASLVPELEKLGVKVTVTTSKDLAQACGRFYDSVLQSSVWHLGTDELASAIDGVSRRPLGDAWAWSRKESDVDISPLMAVTLALWGIETKRIRSPRLINLAEV
jgi:hypothetical protein